MNTRGYIFFAVLLAASAIASAPVPFIQISRADTTICFEAEDFDSTRSSDAYAWKEVVYPADYSGEGSMRAMPNDGGSFGEDYLQTSPRIDYNIAFTKPGTYYVWMRCFALDGASDSCHIGFDGEMTTGGSNVYRLSIGRWSWLNESAYERVSICVVNTGVHQLNVYMREAGFRVDKILLTRDSGYVPQGYGPDARQRGDGITAPSAPANLRAMAGINTVCLNWDENSDAGFASYRVMRAAERGGVCEVIADSLTVPGYTDNSVQNGAAYYYSVTAVNCTGEESAASAEVRAMPRQPRRVMEQLDRGVVAVRKSTGAFISWRLFALDAEGIGFNLYRHRLTSTIKLNSSPLTGGTCFTDTSADFSKDNTYQVYPVIGGVEQECGGQYILKANTPAEPVVNVPLTSGSTDTIRYVWPGDLDGDGQYEFVLDRQNGDGRPQGLEAYELSGELLWTMSLGSASTNTYNIEPSASTIDVGHWDGVTVFDLDCDGKAEVLLRTAGGVVFGDGAVLEAAGELAQFISVIDGETGAEKARAPLPDDLISDGPLAAQVGIGYLDGVRPSLITSMKNRIESGEFNLMVCAWDYDGTSLRRKWKWLRGATGGYSGYCPDSHNIRIGDFDGDGMDEFGHIGYALDSNGTVLYNLRERGIVHGDRWHVGKFAPDYEGLLGYGVQQYNPDFVYEYAYDVASGEILWKNTGSSSSDNGRGDVADLDPRYPGYECWSFYGIFNLATGTRITDGGTEPWPCLRLWWDGDDLSEIFNDGKFEQWDYNNNWMSRITASWYHDTDAYNRSYGGLPLFYGDILGDWREEVVLFNGTYTKLSVFTTDIPTSRRIYTLPQNPLYRNCMTIKGYMQSHHVDYYLGDGMDTPPVPMIQMPQSRFNPADIITDGRVDLADFAEMEVQWLGAPAEPSADIAPRYGDGFVGLEDLQLFNENWLAAQD
ncbi:MAG: hypothetical protein AB7F23_10015 [Phycisphaerae bacterium]